jgi:hypothetical protein
MKIIKESIQIPKHIADLIHPQTRRDVESGNVHFLKVLPHLTQNDITYMEMITSERYIELVERLEKRLGQKLTNHTAPALLGLVQQICSKVRSIEQSHKKVLEQKAVDLVLNLPEFEHIKDLVNHGYLRIQAQLTSDPQIMVPKPEKSHLNDEEETNVKLVQILSKTPDEEKVWRRIFANTLMAGNAQGKASLYYWADETLNKINPKLVDMYGLLLNITDLGFFTSPKPEDINIALGMVEVKNDLQSGDDVYTIHARAVIFPILLHEITKGIMEFLSLRGDLEPEVLQAADKASHEHYDLMVANKIENYIRKHIPADKLKYYPYVFKKLITDVPLADIQQILSGNNRGQQLMNTLIQNIISELGG